MARITAGPHYFRHEDGSPFFYLADTVWMLFNKLTEEEARTLFADRAAKGFTAVQSVIFRDLFEPNTPKVDGVRPFETEADMRAVRINPRWLDYVVRLTKVADEYGLVMGLLPTWGDKWNERSNSAGPVIMDESSARDYCRTLSDALAGCANVIWILGGDSAIQEQRYANVIHAMAEGIRAAGSADKLVTFHPSGLGTSAPFHAAPWLDFNSLQTSHYKPNIPGYLYIERLFGEEPPKPCLDMEPNYEYSPMFAYGGTGRGRPYTPQFSAYDVRKSLYRTVLAGAAGFTYGCEPIRQLHRDGDRIHVWGGEEMRTWTEALAAPGSGQIGYLPERLLERNYFTRVPAQELFLPVRQHGAWADRMATGLPFAGLENTDPVAHISVARCAEGRYILAYTPVRQVFDLDTSGLTGDKLKVGIHDPQACRVQYEYEVANEGTLRLLPERDMDTFVTIDSV
ncbi:MAG: DUF4038 domain-containing protein [Spirochaetota bacterium]